MVAQSARIRETGVHKVKSIWFVLDRRPQDQAVVVAVVVTDVGHVLQSADGALLHVGPRQTSL